MKFLSALLLVPLLAAMPTPVALPSSCTTITPKSLQPLDNSIPEVSFPQELFSGTSNLMVTHNNINATYTTHSLQLIEFEVPQNARTCQLQITDPACSLSLTNSDDYQISDPVQLKVISLHHNSMSTNNNTSYNDIFKAKPSIISSWDFGDANMSAGETDKVINSEACPDAGVGGENGSLFYVLDYQNGLEGYSEWIMLQQDEDLAAGNKLNGVYLTYC